MSFQVTIKPSGHQYLAQEGETILDSALREGFSLSYGCRNGACGSCKGKLLEGRVDHGSFLENALPENERHAGMVLFCTARPLTDIVIESREVGADRDIPIKTMPCRVQKMERAAPDVMILHLKLPANERLQFLAGQYIDILLKDGQRRAFSIANAPHDDEFIELHIRHVPGGAFTGQVFNEMQEKAILRFEGPHGSFFLREDSDKPIIFLAGGTGFAPVKAMIEHALQAHCRREMVLYWGARGLPDLYMAELPRQWRSEHAHFNFVPVLSDLRPEDGWQGRTGLVHQAVLDDHADLSGFQIYACGAPAMVETAQRAFMERGLPQAEFLADAFTFSARR